MRMIIAPDSYKGSLRAVEAARVISGVAERVFPGCEICTVPVADGGEGTAEALLLALGGAFVRCRARDPWGNEIEAGYARLKTGEAVVEMAAASGLPLVAADRREPLFESSFGTGELILRALSDGARKIWVGLGGSATNDGGMGILEALGARFLDADGELLRASGASLERVRSVDLSCLTPLLAGAEIAAICDVKNPLLGENGATYVYGPQKGAGAASLARLEAGMTNYARRLENALGRDVSRFPGAGAAGGAGAALGGVLGARILPGIEAVLGLVGFDALLDECDLVVSGEGRIDGTSVKFGKAVRGIAEKCGARGVPLVVLAGAMEDDAAAIYDVADASIVTSVCRVMPVESAMRDAEGLLASAAERAFRLVRMGQRMREK